MVDLHTHTIQSDGALAPAELSRRAAVKGYKYLGLSDHVDQSNLESVLVAALRAAEALSGEIGLTLLAGVELTHVPPRRIGAMVERARELGADFLVVHGESPVEPVAPGTNLAAIEAGVDILAHPGLISPAEVALAAKMGVYLELSGRGGHGFGNGLVASLARAHGAKLLVNSDAHAPSDLMTPEYQRMVALGAGLSESEYGTLIGQALTLAKRLAKKGGRA
ncbi:MAG: histidinol phosphate phosphatase domain-containing protein [Deltaproteobacteria bacterium]|nr:histidinol phosphate phosphatase domain-containing protein [Deltaproteobacteria bacterium]